MGGAVIEMKNQRPDAADAALAYAAGILGWYPWATRGYLDLSPFKLGVFLAFTLLCLLAVSFLMEDVRPARPAPATVWMLAWAVLTAVSTACSLSPASSLWGSESYLGGLFLCAGCLLGYLLAEHFLPAGAPPFLAGILTVSGAGVGLLGVLNNFGVDPLGFSAAIEESQRNIFFSTIGNVDYLNSLLCLWIPLAVWAYLDTGRLWGLAGSAAGFVCLAALDPGIASLGLVTALAALLWCCPLDGGRWSRLFVLGSLWLAAQLAVQRLQTVFPLRMVERPMEVLGAPLTALTGMAACAVLAVLLRRISAPRQAVQRGLVLGSCAAAALLFVWRNHGGPSLGGFDNLFLLGPGWATDRGAIFADCWALYRNGSLLRKLVGIGPGMLHRAMTAAGSGVPYPLEDAIGAHNEYLEMLLCCGAAGLAAWLGVLVSHLRGALGNRSSAGWALSLCAYAGQAFFNNRVAAVFPMTALVLAMLRVCARDQASPSDLLYRRCLVCALGGGAAILCCVPAGALLSRLLLFSV